MAAVGVVTFFGRGEVERTLARSDARPDARPLLPCLPALPTIPARFLRRNIIVYLDRAKCV